MLLPIKLATTKQPAKKKGKVTPVTPEEQAKGFEGLKRQAKLEEQQIAEFVAKQNYNPAEEARKRGVSVPVQPYESKLNTGVLAEPVLSGEESVAKAQTEPKVAPRVQVNKQGLVVKTIETKYGNVKYTTTPEESKVYLSSDIDAINKLTAEIAKDFEKGFREQGRKKKTETKEKYKFDEVNAALNPNFVDEQTRKGVKAFEDVLLAPFDTFGIRKSLNEVADYAKQSDNALAQFGGGVLESVANPLTTFAMSTGNIADYTATTEQKVGAGLNLATYLVSAIPVGEAVSASINAYRGVRGLAGVAEGINAGAKALLRSVVPGGKIIDRKVTINDLVNVLERNGQMGGKTRGQLTREFASGGKAFAKATGQAPELFYNKYLNDLADQAQPATPAQFDVTAPKASEVPTQVEDLGTVVDDLVGKTEPVVAEPIAPTVEPPVTPPISIVDEIEQGMGASKSTAPPPPTEPTITGIPETPDEQFTSAKNQMTQEVRDEYDMGKFDEPTRRAWEESLTTAKQELQSNANAVDNVIAKVESKQAINEAEQSVLVVALSRERRNARALLEQTNEATSAEEIARLTEQTKIAEDRIDNYTNALNRAGSETARTLNARRAVIDAAEDVISIRAKARQTYGKTLEAADEEAITDIGTELEDINKQIDEATGKGTTPVETVKANTRVKGIKESAPKLQPKADTKRAKQFEAIVNRVKEKLDAFARPSTIETMGVPTEVDIWQPRLNDPASQAYFKQLASVQNDMGKVIQKLVTDEAIEDFDTLLTRLQADGFNITDTDLKLILSADYPTTKLYDFSDIEKEYVKIVRRQLAQEAKGSSIAERGRLIKKIQDLSQKVQAGVRKTTDKTVKTVFEENIDLQNRLDDLQAQYEGYANKLDKESEVAKARIQKDINDLEKEIANPVLKEKLEREIPENVRQLLIERELLRRRKQQVMRKLAAEKDKRDNPSKYAMMNAFKLVNELKFGADASSLFTHGLFNAGTKESALAFKDGISAMFSEKKLSQILSEIKTNPRYQEAIDAGVAGLKERELADSVVYSNVVENVPILKSLYTPGSRFNEAFNARLRMTMYNDAANLMESRWFGAKGTKDAPTRQAIATTINNMTGAMTGKLAKSLNQNEAAREFVGVVFPTIKFLGSRFQLAFGNPALQAAMAKNPALAVYVAKKYARFGALMIGGLYGLDKVLPKDRFKIDNDLKDIKNFGKITDLQTNIVYQPFKNFLDPYKVTLGMEVMRDFMADKDENGIPIESSKPEQSFFERDETSVIANRIGTAPRAAYNLLAGIASPTYKSFGKNLSIRTSEGRINTVTQFAPIAGIQGAELALLKEPATQRDVDLANKLIGIVIAPSGIPISVKKDKGSKARQPVTPGVIP